MSEIIKVFRESLQWGGEKRWLDEFVRITENRADEILGGPVPENFWGVFNLYCVLNSDGIRQREAAEIAAQYPDLRSFEGERLFPTILRYLSLRIQHNPYQALVEMARTASTGLKDKDYQSKISLLEEHITDLTTS